MDSPASTRQRRNSTHKGGSPDSNQMVNCRCGTCSLPFVGRHLFAACVCRHFLPSFLRGICSPALVRQTKGNCCPCTGSMHWGKGPHLLQRRHASLRIGVVDVCSRNAAIFWVCALQFLCYAGAPAVWASEDSDAGSPQTEPLRKVEVLHVHADDLVDATGNCRVDGNVICITVQKLAPC
jgi:hypothetical protein